MIFRGQGRICTSHGYSRLFHTNFLWSEYKNLNKLGICKNNTNRKKRKFKSSCFDDDEISKFFISEGTKPLPKLSPCSNGFTPRGPSLDKLYLRKNPFKKCGGPSLTITTTKPAGLSLLTLTRKKPANDLDKGPFFILNRRQFYSSGSSSMSTPKTGNMSSTRSHRDASSSRGWLNLEGYRIYPWSISGLETCVVVKSEQDKKLAVTFDLGYSTRPSVRCQHVFIR